MIFCPCLLLGVFTWVILYIHTIFILISNGDFVHACWGGSLWIYYHPVTCLYYSSTKWGWFCPCLLLGVFTWTILYIHAYIIHLNKEKQFLYHELYGIYCTYIYCIYTYIHITHIRNKKVKRGLGGSEKVESVPL